MTLEPECGVTEISLNNAKKLIELHGPPDQLDFKADKQHVDYRVTAHWNAGATWTFTGFAWGYGGTGPAGLVDFFSVAKVSKIVPEDLSIDKYDKTDITWKRYNDQTTPPNA